MEPTPAKPSARTTPRRGKTGVILTIVAGLACLVPMVGDGLVHLSYDLGFLVRPKVHIDDPVIIYMDLESHLRLKQDKMGIWDRAQHAKLIDRLRTAGARAVAFDVRFADGGGLNMTAADQALVESARTYGKVAVAAMVSPIPQKGESPLWTKAGPFAELEAVTKVGAVEVATTADFIARRHAGWIDFELPSLAWRVGELVLTNLPADPYRPRWLNYYGPPGTIPSHQYWEVVAGLSPIPDAVFSNKVVFVGNHFEVAVTGGKETDDFRTPFTRWLGTKAAGVEINATAFLNLARGDWLSRSPVWLELLVLLMVGIAAGLGLPRLSPTAAVVWGLAAALLIGTGAIVLVWKSHVWFPWLIVSAVQIPVAVGWSALAYTRRLLEEKRALEASLADRAAASPPAPAPAPSAPAAAPSIPAPPIARSAPAAPPGSGGASTLPSTPGAAPASSLPGFVPAVPDHTLVRRIGEGAYGEVWLARDIIGTYHAAKVVYRRKFNEAAPFEREFNGIKRFTPISRGHPGLVHVLHVGRHDQDEYIYYVMELADDEEPGRPFDERTYQPRNLRKLMKQPGGLSLKDVVQISIQLADSLDYLHRQQLIHRDIKPTNLILVQGRVKLADIGLVTGVANDEHSVSFLGTQGYIPPEGPGTPQADIYSAGKVIYEIATGYGLNRFPEFPTDLMMNNDGSALQELNEIVLKCCERDPAKRYRSAEELKAALQDLATRL